MREVISTDPHRECCAMGHAVSAKIGRDRRPSQLGSLVAGLEHFDINVLHCTFIAHWVTVHSALCPVVLTTACFLFDVHGINGSVCNDAR